MTPEQLRAEICDALRYGVYVGMLRDIINGEPGPLQAEADRLADAVVALLRDIELGEERVDSCPR